MQRDRKVNGRARPGMSASRRRIVIVAAAATCVGTVAAAMTALSLSAVAGDPGSVVASRATLAFGALALTAVIALHLVDQRRSAERDAELYDAVHRGIDDLRQETRSALRAMRDERTSRAQPVTAPMLDRRLEDVSFRLYRQLEARFVLEEMLEPERPLPPLRGWALSPDLAVELVDRVLSGNVRRVLETGSGVSTVLFALALQKVGAEGRVVALEHSEEYAEHTQQLLVRHRCAEVAEVVVAPLAEVSVDDEPYRWYATAPLDELTGGFDLLLVDGPPASTGHRSRFPAVPVLKRLLAPTARIFLDDARREDERAVVDAWVERHGVELVAMHRHDKGSAELSISAPRPGAPSSDP